MIWTAEFASQKWLYDMTPYVETRKGEIIPATLETVTYDGKQWGMPQQTDAAFLYYRTDQIKDAAGDLAGRLRAGQGQRRHRLSGRAVRGPDLRLPRAGLRGRRQGPRPTTARRPRSTRRRTSRRCSSWSTASRTAPPPNGVTTYMEEESRRYFESGKATFMRNWPYAYSLGEKAPAVKGKFDVMPFPAFEGGGKAGILGGHNQVDLGLLEEPGRRR